MLEEKLQQFFSFSTFRPGQKEIVESIISGTDTLALMPTGAGKSLCFQFPAVVFPGLTIVISPLIALMKNQVDSLTARGIKATFLNSSLTIEEQRQRCRDLLKNEYKLLYLAPESLANQRFLHWLAKLPISFIAIDEAHCISSWGHDFRPEYQQIAQYLSVFPQRPIIAAFTATATQLVTQDIQRQLNMRSPAVFIRGFDRPNLRFFVKAKVRLSNRKREALKLIQKIQGTGIIYTLTIKEAEAVTEFLCSKGITAAVYHAQLDAQKRAAIQDAFMEDQYQVVVATVAFGMGIDKADIRYVIHIGMPPNLERYYQEAGRAGRDGELAYCIILQNGRDKATHHFFIQKSLEQMREQGKPPEDIRTLINLKYRQLESMLQYVETTECRRRVILEYFHDPEAATMKKCTGCDRCLKHKWKSDESSADKKDAHGTKAKTKSSAPRPPRDPQDFSDTVLETARLYQEGYAADQIAKIRSIGVRTIYDHFAQWYAGGGALAYDVFVSPEVEQHIQTAITQLGVEKLRPLKDALPESISYEQIKFVIAKNIRATLPG